MPSSHRRHPTGLLSLYILKAFYPRSPGLSGQASPIAQLHITPAIRTHLYRTKWNLPEPTGTLSPRSEPSDRRTPQHLRTMKDPVARTASPYTDPSIKGPSSQRLALASPQELRRSMSSPRLRLRLRLSPVSNGSSPFSPVPVSSSWSVS